MIVLDHVVELKRLAVEGQAAGVGPIEQEHAVDHAVEPTCFAVNDGGVRGDGGRVAGVGGQGTRCSR